MEPNGPQDPPRIVRPPIPTENKTRVAHPIVCKVLLLTGEEFVQEVDKRALGQLLYERVCDHIDLMERDYFGLKYAATGDSTQATFWLDPHKKIRKQKNKGKMEFEFALKFYPPDPTQLSQSLTRYLVTLQIRRDLISGKLPCSLATHAVLGSYAVQSDLGDYDPLDHGHGLDYIMDMPFVPNQTDELLQRIAALHKKHKGVSPEDADLHYLEYAKKISLYGIDLHKAQDSDRVDILLGVGATGISIYRDSLRINRFVWPKILKISYRRNKFLLRIRPAEFDAYESWIAFRLSDNKMAKRLWKIAVEHHSFLRLKSSDDARKRTGFPRFGSKYRYSGRTLYQTRLNASMADRPSKQFDRAHSNRSLNSVLNNNKSRSQDQLNYREPYSHRVPDLPVQSHETHHQQPRSRQPIMPVDDFEDGRTPLQSPLPKEESPKFPSRQIIHHRVSVNDEEDDLDDRLPSVPKHSPKPSPKIVIRKPSTNHENMGGVATPLANLDTSLESDDHEKKNGSNYSPRGSLDSLDIKDEEDVKAKPKPPPVAPKPKKEKPPVAPKPEKPEKPSKLSKGFGIFKKDKKEKESPKKKEGSSKTEKKPMMEVSL